MESLFFRVCLCVYLTNFSLPDGVIEQRLLGNSIHFQLIILSLGNTVSWQQSWVRGALRALVVAFYSRASG